VNSSYTTIQKDQLGKIGAHLKETREQQEKSIEDISLQTYIRPQLIKAIESGNIEDLPQPIFVQGFIRRYADALGLEGLTLSKQFPVHSIPDTPRPNPLPAAKPSMFSSEAMANPVVMAPKPVAQSADRPTIIPHSTRVPAAASRSSEPVPAPVLSSTSATDPSGISPAPSNASMPQPATPAATWPPATSSQPATPSNAMPYILAGILAAGVVGSIAIISSLGGGQNSQTADAPTPEEPAAEIAPTPEVVATPEPAPAPEAPISEAPVYLQVEVTDAGPSWMQVNVDGAVAFEGTVNAGEKKLWEGQNRISINVGNAGAALLSANGAEPEPAGNPGAATVLTFTPDSP
jgi:cytoskeleton protein RodZ